MKGVTREKLQISTFIQVTIIKIYDKKIYVISKVIVAI